MNEQTPVEVAPAIEQQPVVETQPQAPVETAPVQPVAQPEPQISPIEMDFSGLTPEPAPQYQQPQNNDYEAIIQQIVDKTIERTTPLQQQAPVEEVDEDGLVTKKDLLAYREQVKQEVYQDIQKRQEADQIIETNKQASLQVEQKYAERVVNTLKQHNIDIKSDPVLQNAADLLYVQLKTQKAIQLGRPLSNPVLTPYETAELAEEHWKAFSQNFLRQSNARPLTTVTPSLSPAANGISNPGEVPPETDVYQDYRRKTEDGTVKMRDALKILTRGPSQN